MERDTEVGRAAAAIDDRARADHDGSCVTRDRDRLARRASGRDDVFDDEHAIFRPQREAAAKPQRAVLPLGEKRADAERAPNFLADDNATKRRRKDGRRTEIVNAGTELGADRLGIARVLEHKGAL